MLTRIAFYTLLTTSFTALSSAHAILKDPAPRAGQGIAPGPKFANFPPTAAQLAACATSSPGPVSKTYTAGDTIDVKWEVTIPHVSNPGVRVAIRYADNEDFTVLTDGVDAALQTTTVTLPADKASDKATLQWMWASQQDGGFYLECADVAIKPKSAVGGSTGATTAAPTATRSSSPATATGTSTPTKNGSSSSSSGYGSSSSGETAVKSGSEHSVGTSGLAAAALVVAVAAVAI